MKRQWKVLMVLVVWVAISVSYEGPKGKEKNDAIGYMINTLLSPLRAANEWVSQDGLWGKLWVMQNEFSIIK